jgi:hypothetical protein
VKLLITLTPGPWIQVCRSPSNPRFDSDETSLMKLLQIQVAESSYDMSTWWHQYGLDGECVRSGMGDGKCLDREGGLPLLSSRRTGRGKM